ncbi:MAG: dockerin type I repeat-containing protein [Clostridia bacterium]|nr:dockerin type I repeat-containing protein [Clostridia bacterium]
MKKIVSLLAAFVLVLSVMPASAAPDAIAHEKTAVVLTVDSITASADADVEVSLSITGDYEANAFTAFIDFDNTLVTVRSITLGEVAQKYAENGGMCYDNVRVSQGQSDFAANIDGKVGITGILPEGAVTLTGTIFTVVFHTAAGLETGDSISLALDVQVFTNLDLNCVSHPVDHETVDGRIDIDNHEKFTITWLNWNGDVLATDEVEHDTLPVYNGETPTKPADEQNSYEFDGWDPEIVPAVADASYTAQFKTVVNTYTITWKNWDGEVIATSTAEHGTLPEYTGETPTKPADDQGVYEFDGWDPEVVPAVADAEYTAKFRIASELLTVTFVDGITNEVIKTEYVEPGANAVPPEVPVHDGFIFLGWDGSFINVTEDTVVTATYGVLGDADGNGAVEATDALLVLRMAMGIINTPDNVITIDADGDGEVTAADALLILRYAMGILSEL